MVWQPNLKKNGGLDHTVVNHLKLMEGRFTVFSSTIKEVTCVNNTLEELIANDSALVKSFGEPDRDPTIEFHAKNFKQDVRAAIISSRRVLHTVKSVARYASNASLVPRPTHVFQRFTRKIGKAWSIW